APSKPATIILSILLIGCLLVLTKFILFKKSPAYYRNYFRREFSKNTYRDGMKKANLVPFKTIRLMQSNNLRTEYKVDNVAGNIVGFIPLGILLPMLFPGLRRIWKTTFLVLFISFCFEAIQLYTGLGIFDVDDLILNTAGGIIGYLFY